MDEDRREFDQHKWEEWDKKLTRFVEGQHTMRRDVRELRRDVNDLRDFLRGGIDGKEDPLVVRVGHMEIAIARNEALFDRLRRKIEGDPLNRKESIEAKIDLAEVSAKEAKEIAEGKQTNKTARRGQLLVFLGTCVVAAATITTAVIANWDRVEALLGRQQDPQVEAERIRSGIKRLKQTRGPEVQKKLREIEAEIRRRM